MNYLVERLCCYPGPQSRRFKEEEPTLSISQKAMKTAASLRTATSFKAAAEETPSGSTHPRARTFSRRTSYYANDADVALLAREQARELLKSRQFGKEASSPCSGVSSV